MRPTTLIMLTALAGALTGCGSAPDRFVGAGTPTNSFASNYPSVPEGASAADQRRIAASQRSALTPPREISR